MPRKSAQSSPKRLAYSAANEKYFLSMFFMCFLLFTFMAGEVEKKITWLTRYLLVLFDTKQFSLFREYTLTTARPSGVAENY